MRDPSLRLVMKDYGKSTAGACLKGGNGLPGCESGHDPMRPQRQGLLR